MQVIQAPHRHNVPGSAFDGSRPLRVFLDPELNSGEKTSLVLRLVAHDSIEAFSTESISPTVTKVDVGAPLPEQNVIPFSYDGWMSAIHAAHLVDHFARRLAQRYDIDSARSKALLVTARLAFELGVDVLVTESRELLEEPRGWARESNARHPRDAVALLGLHLRAQGTYVVDYFETGPYEVSRKRFYWAAAYSVLPHARRWYSACQQASIELQDDPFDNIYKKPDPHAIAGPNEVARGQPVGYLGQALIGRFGRFLRARDELLISAHAGAEHGDLAGYLEDALLMLSAAFDISARVAHRAAGLPRSATHIGWRKPKFVKRLCAREPAFAPLLAHESTVADTAQILATLRNTIHDVGLFEFGYATGGVQRNRSLILVPASDRDGLLEATDRLGGHATWGVMELDSATAAVDPAVFIDALATWGSRGLDRIMATTPVCNLPGVNDENLPTSVGATGLPRVPAHQLLSLAGLHTRN